MTRKTQLILIIIAALLYLTAFISFFTDFIYVKVLDAGVLGSYKGYEVAFNFDGMPQNLGTLFPLLVDLGTLIFAIIIIIKIIIGFKKAPKKAKGGSLRPLLSAFFFVLCPLITLFLALSTFDMLNLPAPKKYGGYYMGVGPYLVAYCTLVGGLILFISLSNIFEIKYEEAKPEDKSPKKSENKPAPQQVANKPSAANQQNVVKPAPKQETKVVPNNGASKPATKPLNQTKINK